MAQTEGERFRLNLNRVLGVDLENEHALIMFEKYNGILDKVPDGALKQFTENGDG